jgi:hypothetical protein
MSGKQSSDKAETVAATEEVVTGNGGTGMTPPAAMVTALPSIVTAPVNAMALPANDAPVPNDTEDEATTSPTITADVPMVAELPTCQNTFLASAPLVRSTVALTLMVNADPTWKMKFPFPLKVNVPPTDRSKVLDAVYVPGVRTCPAS